jgi:hypothetical protein
MSSYTELRPFLLDAFRNVCTQNVKTSFDSLRISIEGEGGTISLDQALTYLHTWYGICLTEFIHEMFVEADRLRWKLSSTYIE